MVMPPLWMLKAGGMLVLFAGFWVHGYRHGGERQKRLAAVALQAATDAARAEESRRVMRLQENVDAAYLKQRQAESDARDLRAARDGLLDVAERAGAAACNPAPAADGSPAPARAVVPSDLFRSVEERAEQLAGALDASRIAGQLCERAYDSLNER